MQIPMGSASRYWQWVRLNGVGQRQEKEIPLARAYFKAQFPQWIDSETIPDATIQRQLMEEFRSESASHQQGAAACLRCYISYQIDQACSDLFKRFGQEAGFGYAELLTLVLDDFELLPTSSPRSSTAQSAYQSLADKILQTFNPERAQLSTWTARLVKSHPELTRFLWECGVHLKSDWAILNSYRPQQLERLLTQSGYTQAEAQQAAHLLQSYRKVYLSDRLQQNQGRSCSRCRPPTPEQLGRMVALLVEQGISNYSPDDLLEQLETFALMIRRARQPKRESPPEDIYPDEPSAENDTDEEMQEFLRQYRQMLTDQLDQAIQQVLDDRVNYLKRKPPKDQNFLKGLRLHCQGQSMATIADQIGLAKQYQVSRLLQLKQMRQDVQRQLLKTLKDQVEKLASYYTDLTQLTHLEQAVADEVDRIMAEAHRETSSSDCSRESLFIRRLCQHL